MEAEGAQSFTGFKGQDVQVSGLELAPLCHWQSLSHFSKLQLSSFGAGQRQQAQDAALRKKKRETEQSPVKPRGPQAAAVATTAATGAAAGAQAAAGTIKRSRPAPVKSRKGSPDVFQSPVRSHQVLSCPCVSIVFGLEVGGGKLNHELP